MRIECQADQWPVRCAAPYDQDPEVGIEEYPTTNIKQLRQLAEEVKAQGGPATVYNHFRSPDARIQHLYVARNRHDGTIQGVLGALRTYDKMEPKYPSRQNYRSMYVEDLYASSKAPPHTGTKLMQSAADRARRDGSDFYVSGMVPAARGFYENMGADTRDGSSMADWDKEHRDALARGEPLSIVGKGSRQPGFGDMFINSEWSDPGSIPHAEKWFADNGYEYAI